MPLLQPFAGELSLLIVVVLITYLTLVLGELVPKQLALRQPEVRRRPRGAGRSRAGRGSAAPVVWVLGRSSALVLRLFGAHAAPAQTVTEEELKALLAEGAQAGVLETEERDMIERVLRLADKPVRAIMTPRTEMAWIDRTDPRREIVADAESARRTAASWCATARSTTWWAWCRPRTCWTACWTAGNCRSPPRCASRWWCRTRSPRWTRWSG